MAKSSTCTRYRCASIRPGWGTQPRASLAGSHPAEFGVRILARNQIPSVFYTSVQLDRSSFDKPCGKQSCGAVHGVSSVVESCSGGPPLILNNRGDGKLLKGEPPVKPNYHTIDKQGKGERKLAEFLVRNGQALLPMMALIEQSRMAIDELIQLMGRASIEAVLQLSAAAGGRRTPARQGAPKRRSSGTGLSGWRVSEGAQTAGEEAPFAEEGRGANKEVAVSPATKRCNRTP